MTAKPPTTEPIQPDSLRLVLFGLPNAGKSSLLGALGQAVQTQEHLLNGKLADLSHGLEEQCRRLYQDEPRRTANEVVPYSVEYLPRGGGGVPVVIMDCDGRVANDILASQKAPAANSPQGSLAHEIVHADTLVLVVDAAANPAHLDADFAEFGRFLRLLEESRGGRAEVGGLPVFLVLTKCDLLAQPGDSAMDWTERIEDRKADVDARFRKSLSAGEAAPVFGRLDLHLWATAVKRPALKGAPARPREPYLVAELFRQCLAEAAAHRGRVGQSHRRLGWLAGGAGGLVAALLAAIVGLFWMGEGEKPSELQLRVEDLMFTDRATPAERLRGNPALLRERLELLESIQQDAQFHKLKSRFRDFVRDRTTELKDYLAYAEKLRQALRPADAVREETLREIKDTLTSTLALPHADWAGTEAGHVRQERLEECDALAAAVRAARDWYRDCIDQARELWNFARHAGTPEAPGIDWRAWLDDVEELLDPARAPPFNENDPLPGAPALTYASVFRFDKVVEARADWDGARQKLERVRDVCAAVGLVTGVKGKPAVLLIPRTGFTLEAARDSLRELQTAYPSYRVDFVRAGLPDALLPELGRTALNSYEHALEPARAAVLNQLQHAGTGTQETVARWNAVRNWLVEPEQLAAWRVLALTLARLHDAEARDPVTALADFLKKTSFSINIRGLTLEVPDSVKARPAFGATLAIYQPRTRQGKPALAFKMDGEGERSAQDRLLRCKFQLQEGGALTYRPGDELWATLPLRDDLMFTWARCRSALYQFERLNRPPRLHRAKQESSEGSLIDKVHLLATPPNGVPAVPDLMPVVDLR